MTTGNSGSIKEPCVQTRTVVKVVSPGLSKQLQNYRMRLSAIAAGYPVLTDWHPVIPEGWGEFPQLPTKTATIYRGDAGSWAYSHHHAITKLGEKYVASWSNGRRDEDHVGQEVHCAWSEDGRQWSEPQAVAHTPVSSGLVRHNAGLCSANGRLYCYVGVAADYGRDSAPPGAPTIGEQPVRLDVYVTQDLRHWQHHEDICDNVYLFEGPRPTQSGRFMCCGFDVAKNYARILIWADASHLAERPRVVDIHPSPNGMLPEQGTWYQSDDGRIWMYQRDSGLSCSLGLTWSDDEGDTWSELSRTNFPNTYSRAFAGRLADGRCYIAGNNYDILLDRRHLLVALSDDGYTFDRQYTLIEGDTTRRIEGRHKENGYHYPNCLVDGDNLFVIYSVNKEDIEACMVDMSSVP